MQNYCTIELFAGNRWVEAANVSLTGDAALGTLAPTSSGYGLEYAVAWQNRRDAHALSSGFPVSLTGLDLRHWPVFLIDMLPQGYGRQELLRRLDMPETTEAAGDWPLLLAGAGNPIGNLRVKEAAQWLQQQDGPLHGFTDEDVAMRADDFTEYLARHGLFVAGSSGVQGEWPKILLTRADDGLLYLDHALPDERAREHYIVKFGRGPNERLAQILRQEAPYMEIARHLGLRVHAKLWMLDRALFIPRFDRRVDNGKVMRVAQESLATLTDKPGFGQVPTHDEACLKLCEVASDPLAEVCEYLRRDVANIALANKDNHARNTAIARDEVGHVALTPLFDFAPMYLHPDGISRRIRWSQHDNGSPDWQAVIDMVAEQTGLPRTPLLETLQAMAAPLREVADHGGDFGLENDVLAYLQLPLRTHAERLLALH
ncbi:capsule biosynthesis enzymes related protein [Herbaspirillum sp. CF444]|uniref:type II toxin-antitoxin system HipA family toxin n=1 Tax=Herbaspirillum sp. CF444 TaxID=1144319 RepID=UPI00027239D5|nr:HipA domain-containing protein [Herbaspirillum sp. CF444]EJL92014.1 capsule biosynthesis enzymes related protein [Herbaspirillum sp. CF444]